MKRIIVVSMIVLLVLGVAGLGYAGINSGFFQRDKLIEEGQSTKTTSVSVPEANTIDDISILHDSKIADDGSLVFNVKDNPTGDVIGTFTYKPWLEDKPLYCKLSNGDIILGKEYIYSKAAKKINMLADTLNMGVYDYDVSQDKIALIGPYEGSEMRVYLKSVKDGKLSFIDSFKYPDYVYPDTAYLGWGNDGLLYYDYCINQKPAIRVYDTETNQVKSIINNTISPQISPDKQFMVVYAVDSFNTKNRKVSELQLLNLNSQEKIAALNGSKLIFWAGDYLLVRNVDNSTMIVYELKEKGREVKEFKIADLPYAVSIANDIFTVKSYRFDNSTFTIKSQTVSLK